MVDRVFALYNPNRVIIDLLSFTQTRFFGATSLYSVKQVLFSVIE